MICKGPRARKHLGCLKNSKEMRWLGYSDRGGNLPMVKPQIGRFSQVFLRFLALTLWRVGSKEIWAKKISLYYTFFLNFSICFLEHTVGILLSLKGSKCKQGTHDSMLQWWKREDGIDQGGGSTDNEKRLGSMYHLKGEQNHSCYS